MQFLNAFHGVLTGTNTDFFDRFIAGISSALVNWMMSGFEIVLFMLFSPFYELILTPITVKTVTKLFLFFCELCYNNYNTGRQLFT